jgi:hypothetical protein
MKALWLVSGCDENFKNSKDVQILEILKPQAYEVSAIAGW